MALKRLFPLQIAQDGAALNEVLAWDGSQWTPAALTAIGGASIYTGSGTIGAGVAGSVTNATLPTGNSGFNLRYSDNSNAIQLENASGGTLSLYSGTVGESYIQLLGPTLVLGSTSNTTIMSDTETSFGGPVFIDYLGGTLNTKAALELNTTTKGLLLPRLSAAEFATYDLTGTTDGMMLYNTTTDTIKVRANGVWIDLAASGSGLLTASNGLTAAGSNVKLGGALVDATTTITGDATNHLIITGARTSASDASLLVNNTSSGSALIATASGIGRGIIGQSNTGIGVYASSTSGIALSTFAGSGTAINAQVDVASTNTVQPILTLNRTTTGTADVGIGSRILFQHEVNDGTTQSANNIVSKWTNATLGTRLSEFSVTGYSVSTENTLLTLSGTGAARLNQYGGSGFTGIPTRTLQVDSSGNIIQNSTVTLGNGIYGGSGDIPNNTVAKLVTGGDFTIDYFDNTDALRVDDSTGAITLQSKTASTSLISITNSNIITSFGGGGNFTQLDINGFSTGFDNGSVEGTFYVDATGAHFDSVNKMLRPPRMTTAERTAIVTPEEAGLVYDTDTDLMYYRNASAFVSIGNVAGLGGIYTGSGTIAPGATATTTTNSFFKFEYAGGNDAFILDSTTGSERLDIRGKDTGGDYSQAIFHKDYLFVGYGGTGLGATFTETDTSFNTTTTKITKASYRTGVITPALITSNQNDYALGDSGESTYVRISSDAARDITGIAGGVAGREIVLINIGTQNITLKSDSASSSPTNRMLMRNATDTTLLPAQCVTLWYDDPGSNARWRVTSGA